MNTVYAMTKRNCLLFFRDKSAVFYSVFSMLIALGLMVLFLGKMNSRNVVMLLAEYGGPRDTFAAETNAVRLVQLWTLGGILVVNAVTATFTAVGQFLEDEDTGKNDAFYTAPALRIHMILGYVLSAWAIGFSMCLITLAVGLAYLFLNGCRFLGLDVLCLSGMLAVNTFLYATVGYFLTLLFHSRRAWGSVLSIIGTLVGFAAGIYVDITSMSKPIQQLFKTLPVLHGASMMRRICTDAVLEKTFCGMPETAVFAFKERMGISVVIKGKVLSIEMQILFLAGCAIIIIIAASLIQIHQWRTKGR